MQRRLGKDTKLFSPPLLFKPPLSNTNGIPCATLHTVIRMCVVWSGTDMLYLSNLSGYLAVKAWSCTVLGAPLQMLNTTTSHHPCWELRVFSSTQRCWAASSIGHSVPDSGRYLSRSLTLSMKEYFSGNYSCTLKLGTCLSTFFNQGYWSCNGGRPCLLLASEAAHCLQGD